VRGARVLDVGCGSGILSMFAARGGAASVVGLDASERIAGFARKVGQTRARAQWGFGCSSPRRRFACCLGGGCALAAAGAGPQWWRCPQPLPPWSRQQSIALPDPPSPHPKNVAANGLDRESGGPVSIVTGRVERVTDIGSDQVRGRRPAAPAPRRPGGGGRFVAARAGGPPAGLPSEFGPH
jgi:hypothetical protein